MMSSAGSAIIILQIVMFLLFLIFARYDWNDGMEDYPLFQDIHVMVFLGFGFLMTFLRRYAFSALGFTLLLGATITQWAILCRGVKIDGYHLIVVNFESLVNADVTTASVLISLGVILGISTQLQLLLMSMTEVIFFSINIYISSNWLKVCDTGGSILIHTFGAYFGLAVSYVIGHEKCIESRHKCSRYNSDIFAMIGTIFLWLYWPSFNGISLPPDLKYRAVINTYLSLASSCVTAFSVSSWLTGNGKFDIVHIQNSTLAGGVAIGSSVSLLVQPYGALMIGMIAGFISVFGFVKITPWLSEKWNINDTCGVHNLHGIPGVLGGFTGALMALFATEEDYGTSLYHLYPARSAAVANGETNTTTQMGGEEFIGRDAKTQAAFQLLSIPITISFSIIAGLLTGRLMNLRRLQLTQDEFFIDTPFWKFDYEYTLPQSAAPIQVAPGTKSYIQGK